MPRVRTLTPDGDEIRRRRLAKAFKPEALAAKIHRHPQTIRGIERGHIKLASELLVWEIARALGTTAKQITRADYETGTARLRQQKRSAPGVRPGSADGQTTTHSNPEDPDGQHRDSSGSAALDPR